MNSLRYLSSSIGYRSEPPAAAGNTRPRGDHPDTVALRDEVNEKAAVQARQPTRKHDEARRSRRGKEAEAEGPATRRGLVWWLLGKLLPFLLSESPKKPKERKHRQTSSSALPPIPRMLLAAKRKTLVLDLDETLIHSMTRGNSSLGPNHIVEVHLKNSPMSSFYYVAKRPHCIDFLQAVLQWYDVVIFTASVKEYADPIIDLLESDLGVPRAFKQRFYRTDCIPDNNGGYIKDLSVIGEDLARVMLVDNSAISYARHQSNGIPVEGWISDPSDRVLIHLLPLLFALRHTIDVRSVLCLQNFGTLMSI